MSRAGARVVATVSILGAAASVGVAWERLDGTSLRDAPGQAPGWSLRPWLVDLDAAPAEELEALPGVGPRLARRIVSDRAARGSFGTLEALDRVPGVGPSLIERLRPHVRTARAAATVVGHGG